MKDPWSQEMDGPYWAFRAQIEHEDHLVGIRISWLMAAEAFLFAAYATALAVPAHAAHAGFQVTAVRLYEWLPIVGILLAAFVFLAVTAALMRLGELHRDFKRSVGKIHGYPKVTSKKLQRMTGRIPGVFAPLVVIIAWSFVRW